MVREILKSEGWKIDDLAIEQDFLWISGGNRLKGQLITYFAMKNWFSRHILRILEILGSPCDLQRHSNPQD